MKNYAIVGFIYTQACPLSCNFCCHTKEVVGPGKFDPRSLLPILEDFSRHSSVTRFAFSGGDPFLRLEEILTLMDGARRLGVKQPFHMVTSGYWADSQQGTVDTLTRLRDVGMDALDVSYDTEHARFVRPENIYHIQDACKQLSIRLEVFGNFWHRSETVEDLLPKLTSVESVYSHLVMPVGAARIHFRGKRYDIPDDRKYSCGKPKVYDIAIYPDGSVYPCCSGGFNREAKLECGNVFVDSADSVLARAFGNFHARIAKEIGFNRLYERVRTLDHALFNELPRFGDVDSVCEICRDINRNDSLRGRLEKYLEEMEEEYVLESFEQYRPALKQKEGYDA